MRKQIFTNLIALLVLVLALNSCAFLKPDIKAPKVKIENVEVADAKLDGATLIFVVRVDNPNKFALRVDSVNYNLDLGGKPLTTGAINDRTEVAALANTQVRIPIPVKYADFLSSLSSLLQTGASTYHLRGAARLGLISVPFDETGEFKIENGELKKVK